MIIQEGPPGLGGWLSAPHHVLGHGGLGDFYTKHLELTMQARSAPVGFLLRDPAN